MLPIFFVGNSYLSPYSVFLVHFGQPRNSLRKGIEDFRFEQNQKSVVGKNKNTDKVRQTLTITFDKDISSRRLNDKLNELDCITDKDFKVEVDIGRFSKYLKQPSQKRVKKK